MSAPAPITASGPSQAPHEHRNAPRDAGSERAFHIDILYLGSLRADGGYVPALSHRSDELGRL